MEADTAPGSPAKSGLLAALVLNDVPGYSIRHVEQAAPRAAENMPAELDFIAVASLRNYLHLIP